MNEQAQQLDSDTSRWVSFGIGGESHAISVMKVREVLHLMDIAPVAGAPSFVLGIMNLRGNVVTVIDTNVKFGMGPCERNERSRVMIIESGEILVGLVVEQIGEVLDVPEGVVQPPPHVGNTPNRCVSGVINMDKKVYILLDVDELLSDAITEMAG